METLSALLVGKPLNILSIAGLFLAGHLAFRLTPLGAGRHPTALLWAAAVWAVYAAWEWLVRSQTPEANIRVDLLLIWPLLLVASIVSVVKVVRSAA